MTVVVVLAAPPRSGLVFSQVAETTPLSATAASDLYAAALADTLRTAEAAGGDLLVNYRDRDTLPADHHGETEPAAAVRAVASEALRDVTAARFEPQVGSTPAARVGNTVTHLLREEGADSVVVLRPVAPLLQRPDVDTGTMRLRSNETVLGTTTDGAVYYAGFTDPVAFEDAFQPPAVETLTERARDADHDVAFLPAQPAVDSAAGLRSFVPTLRARVHAEQAVPPETATFVHEHGLRVRDGTLVADGGPNDGSDDSPRDGSDDSPNDESDDAHAEEA